MVYTYGLFALCAYGTLHTCECTLSTYEEFFRNKYPNFIRFVALKYITEIDEQQMFCRSGSGGHKKMISLITLAKDVPIDVLKMEFTYWETQTKSGARLPGLDCRH